LRQRSSKRRLPALGLGLLLFLLVDARCFPQLLVRLVELLGTLDGRELVEQEQQLRARDALGLAATQKKLREPSLELAVACDQLAEEREHFLVAPLGEQLSQHLERWTAPLARAGIRLGRCRRRWTQQGDNIDSFARREIKM